MTIIEKRERTRPLRQERTELMLEIRKVNLLIEAFKMERNGHLLIRSGIADIRRAAFLKPYADKGKVAPRWGVGHNPTADRVEKVTGNLKETLDRMIEDQIAILMEKGERLEAVRAQLRQIYGGINE